MIEVSKYLFKIMRNQLRCQPILGNCKTCTPVYGGNAVGRSECKSGVSGVGRHEKHPQVKSSMAKLMNLKPHPVRPYTHATHLLTRMMSHGKFTGSKACLLTMGSRNATQASMGQGPKLEEFEHNGTMGLPKADPQRVCYGNGSAILVHEDEGRKDIKRQRADSITTLGGELAQLYDLNIKDPKHVNTRVIHRISDVSTLKLAYEIIKSLPGIPGSDKQTLDETSLPMLQRLSHKLRAGKFKFTPAPRTCIPKPRKKDLRSLTSEQIVPKAIELVLTGIYEPSFLDTSHGFRPHRGTHTALKMIDQVCKNANWFMVADISKCDHTIDHPIMMKLLQARINCDKTLALLRSALKAGYITRDTSYAQTGDVVTPQGSVVSPLLCNIYMHQLDVFMEELMHELNNGKSKHQFPAYTSLANRLAKAKLPSDRIKIRRLMKLVPAKDPMDPNMIRVKYIRYADDFVISVLGPYRLAEEVKRRMEEFLESELRLQVNQTKTLITNTSRQEAKFLGTIIRTEKQAEKPQKMGKHGRKIRLTPRVSLHAPIKEIFGKLKIQGFVKQNSGMTQSTPTALRRLVNMDHADILKYYNSVLRGILNYYSFADNRKSLGSVVRALQMSCARTLALKFKLRFASKVFKKFGKHLKDADSDTKLHIPDTYRRTRQFSARAPLGLKAIERFSKTFKKQKLFKSMWANKLTKSGLNQSCVVCGTKPVEMHHLRNIKERYA